GTDWRRYASATAVTPDLGEFEAVAGGAEPELAAAAQALRERLDIDALLVTRSAHGMSLFSATGHLHLSAHAHEVYDVTGAGDTVIALLGAGLASGQEMEDAATIANLGAG